MGAGKPCIGLDSATGHQGDDHSAFGRIADFNLGGTTALGKRAAHRQHREQDDDKDDGD